MNPQADHRSHSAFETFSREHRTGLLTIVFTDIVGSTALKKQWGEHEAMGLCQRHNALVREVLSKFSDAQEIETAGDSFLLVFVRPSEAVAFSLELQARLRALDRETAKPVLDRIGIHVGE